MSFKIEGFKELYKKVEVMPGALDSTYVTIMQKSVLHVRRESQKITPVDTGNLRASARSEAKGLKDMSKGEVWYRADYAVPVHERTWTKLKSGQHKFLERAVHGSRAFIKRLSFYEIRKALRRFAK